MEVRPLPSFLLSKINNMEIEIKISTPLPRILPGDHEMKVDVAVRGIEAQDIHLFADMRPIVAAVLNAQIDAAQLEDKIAQEIKESIKPFVFGEDA